MWIKQFWIELRVWVESKVEMDDMTPEERVAYSHGKIARDLRTFNAYISELLQMLKQSQYLWTTAMVISIIGMAMVVMIVGLHDMHDILVFVFVAAMFTIMRLISYNTLSKIIQMADGMMRLFSNLADDETLKFWFEEMKVENDQDHERARKGTKDTKGTKGGMMSNALANPSFDFGTWVPKGQMGLVLPTGWTAGCLDDGKLLSYSMAGVTQIGTYSEYGPRRADYPCLKPEILVIERVAPELDPIRIDDGAKAVKGFKTYGTVCWWLAQRVGAKPGDVCTFNARAHAWSRLDSDPNDAHFSNGVGTGAFFALERAAGLSDGQRNYRFRVGIDPFGGVDPFGSAVIWGPGAHIYNVFNDIPQIQTQARADIVTVFIMVDCLYGMLNSNAYLDTASLEFTTVVEPPVPPPTVDYVVTAHLLPPDATLDETLKVTAAAFETKNGLEFSADDVKRLVLPGKPGSKVIAWAPGRWANDIVAWLAPCAVEVREFNVPPPVPVYPKHGTGIGLHVEVVGMHTGYRQWLEQCYPGVGLIKAVNDGGSLMEAHEVDPKTITVWRSKVLYEGKEDMDNPPGDWWWPVEQAPAIADKWMTKLCERWQYDKGVTNYLEIMNEPNGSNLQQFKAQAAFTQSCMEWADKEGIKLAIYGFSSGCPKSPLAKEGEPDELGILLPTFKYAAEHGHIVSLHDGSVDGSRPLFEQAAEDGTALRWRLFERALKLKGWSIPGMAVTECYLPSGERNLPIASLQWYLREMAKDPYILGMALFAWNNGFMAQLKNIAKALEGL